MSSKSPRRLFAALFLALLVVPFTGAASGQVIFDDERSIQNRDLYRRHRHTFQAETRVKLTYAAEKTGNGCHFRVRIYRRIDHGDRDYRILDRPVHLRNESGSDVLYATLPPGDYRFDVDAKRMDIHVTLEVATDEDDE
ncbi:MAG: hypothetical protein AAGA29_08730 [Planctomycetota bacterium]